MVVRAFLSHTSTEKEFVRAVAQRLGRAIAIFDEASFSHGQDLVSLINAKLDETTLFVLFASRKSLAAPWVQYEIREALHAKLRRRIQDILVIALEPSIGPTDLPPPLTQSLFKFCPSAETATRAIRARLDVLLSQQMPAKFVGRQRELKECENALGGLENPPRVIAFYGIDGIGRRTLCARVARDLLQLQRLVFLEISSADSLADITFRIKLEMEPPSSPERLAALQKELDATSLSDLKLQLAKALSRLLSLDELPVFVDQGGILGYDGGYSVVASELLAAVGSVPNLTASIIAKRRPPDSTASGVDVASISVGALETTDVEHLLALLLRGSKASPSKSELESLAQRINGYPPSAYYAARLIQRYGFDVVQRRTGALEELQASNFLRHLENVHAVSRTAGQVLRLVAAYSPLPAMVVEKVLGLSGNECGTALADLIDLTLIVPEAAGLYGVSRPVRIGIERVYGGDKIAHDKVAEILQGYLDGAAPEERDIRLCEHLFRASSLSGEATSSWAVQFARDLLELAVTLYNQSRYERSLEFARLVVAQRPTDHSARQYLVRGLIQTEQHSEARREIAYFKREGFSREYHFFSGFLQRKQHRIRAAISEYELAIKAGKRGVALHRELALCYFLEGEVEKAREHIAIASEQDPDNKFLVDLQIKIAIANGNRTEARRLCTILEAVDRAEFVAFRRSMVDRLEGNLVGALQRARHAVQTGRPTFEMRAQVTKCLIELGHLSEAAGGLTELDRIFKDSRHDVRRGLWCKWHIASQNWDEAERHWNALEEKGKPVHLALRKQILKGSLSSSGLATNRRDALEKELGEIDAELQKLGDEAIRRARLVDEFAS